MKKKTAPQSNTKIAILFFLFLVFVVCVSIIFKTIILVSEGKFDSSKRFTISISNNKNLEAVSIHSPSKSIVILKLEDNINPGKAGNYLKVPIDGLIVLDSLDFSQRKIDSLFLKTILEYKNLRTNLTIIDLLKLLWVSKSVPESNAIVENISSNLSGGELDKLLGRLVIDELIEKDNQTIQIINGTNISGFGNRLARLVTNMGGDVIIVATSDKTHKKSIISYIGDKTYTVERLQEILGYEVVKAEDNAISNISIIIGEDKVKSAPF